MCGRWPTRGWAILVGDLDYGGPYWARLPLATFVGFIAVFAGFTLLLLQKVRLLGVSVSLHLETEHQSSQILKPKTEKTKISVRFAAVRFGARFSV